MLSNSLFTASKNSNRRLAGNLISWLSNERGIIRRGPLDYSCTDASGKDSECPKGCYFRFSMDLEYWNWKRREWEPYSDPSVALEITMMTPKYRSNLPETKERKGHYKVRGPMPYRMGTYRFKVNHNRPGWNRVSVYRKIEMRNNHYLEYTKKWGRDLTSAVGVVCILASFALVSFIFVYDDERAKLLN
jgi:hypothetical protein